MPRQNVRLRLSTLRTERRLRAPPSRRRSGTADCSLPGGVYAVDLEAVSEVHIVVRAGPKPRSGTELHLEAGGRPPGAGSSSATPVLEPSSLLSRQVSHWYSSLEARQASGGWLRRASRRVWRSPFHPATLRECLPRSRRPSTMHRWSGHPLPPNRFTRCPPPTNSFQHWKRSPTSEPTRRDSPRHAPGGIVRVWTVQLLSSRSAPAAQVRSTTVVPGAPST